MRHRGGIVLAWAMVAMGARAAKPVPATPIGDAGAWLMPEDYPASALRAGQSGMVRVSLDIDAAGHVSCRVVQSSKVPALDEGTCALLQARARFQPARDAKGHPIASSFVRTVRWQLPANRNVDITHAMTCAADDRDVIQVEFGWGCIS